MNNVKRNTRQETLVRPIIKFHPHGDMSLPACWMHANETCRDRRCNFVMNNRIIITVSLEYLKLDQMGKAVKGFSYLMKQI